jgi:hypothetical protein
LISIPVLLNPDGLLFSSSAGGSFALAAGSTGLVNFAGLGASWQNITSFSMAIVGNANNIHRIDSIVVNNEPTVAGVVPELSSVAIWSVLALAVGIVWQRGQSAKAPAPVHASA